MVLPLLATGLGTALVPAIVGFVGVVVGSVLTWIREAHRQRGKTIAAGRLVGAELADTAKKVERLPPGPSARAALAAQLDTPSWEQERGDLALGLDAGEWGEVREAFALVAALRVGLENEGADIRAVDRGADDLRAQIEKAQEALGTLERRRVRWG